MLHSMRRINIYIGILALSFPALMFGAGGENGTKKYPNRNGLAAACSPASNIIRLNFNNVKMGSLNRFDIEYRSQVNNQV